jgi:hypothetical protein
MYFIIAKQTEYYTDQYSSIRFFPYFVKKYMNLIKN